MADRFTYLPSLSPFMLLGLGGAIVLNKAAAGRALVNGALVGTVVLVAALSYATVKQITVWQSSISLWNYVIEKEPRRILNAYLNRGVAFGDRKEFDRAIEDFTTALGIDPQSGSHYLNRGMAYVSKGELDRAIADYDRALALNPRYVDAYVNRGSVWLRKKEFDRALADYDRALTLQPGFVPALINRGLVFREKGETGKAIEDYSRAISLSPEARVYLGRGDLYMKTGDVERAVKDYQKACDLGSKEGCSKAFFPVQTLFPPPQQ
jgi:tetratricopeptide (TPR) repeat protein